MKASLAYKNRWSDTGRSWFVFEADLPGYEFEREIKNESVLVNGEIVKREFLEKNTNLISSAELKWGLRVEALELLARVRRRSGQVNFSHGQARLEWGRGDFSFSSESRGRGGEGLEGRS